MDEKERLDKLERQSNEIYREIGRFIVTFEHLMRWNRDATYWMLQRAIGFYEFRLAQAFVDANLSMMSVPEALRALYSAAVMCPFSTDGGLNLVKKFVGSCDSLNSERNKVVHNAWMVGWAAEDQTDFSSVLAGKHRITNRGVEPQSSEMTAAKFAGLSERAKELIRQCKAVLSCASMGRPFEAHLKLDDKGNVVTHGATFPA